MKKIGKYFTLFIFIAIGMVCGVLMTRVSQKIMAGYDSVGYSLLAYFALFVIMYVVIILQIAMHEAGHLLFGLLTGYRFVSYRIFSWMWMKQGDKIVLKKFTLGGTGGQCLLDPPGDINEDFPVVLYNLGGVIVNLVTALVFFLLSRAFAEHPFLSAIFLIFAVCGLGFGIANGIPVQMAINNDGWNTLDFLRNPKAKRAFWIQMKISAMTSKGIRLSEMPAEWFELPETKDMENGLISYIGVVATDRLMDEGKQDEAYALRKDMLERNTGMPDIYRILLKEEIIFYELTHGFPTEEIQNIHDAAFVKSLKPFTTLPSVLKTECIYALALEKDTKKATKLKKQFDKVISTYPYPTEVNMESSMLESALNQFGYNA